LKTSKKIITATGKKVQTWNPKIDDKDRILKQAIGRSGNLRVPALFVKNMYIIGFNEDLYNTLVSDLSG